MKLVDHAILLFPSFSFDLYLSCCITVLVAACFHASYYKDPSVLGLFFQQNLGDWVWLLIVALWTSRHVIIKFICLTDTSTCRSPTLQGVFATFVTLHLTGGQTFDQPVDVHSSNGSLIPYSVRSLIHWFYTVFGAPILDFFANERNLSQPIIYKRSNSSSRNKSKVSAPVEKSFLDRYLGTTLNFLHDTLTEYGFTLQFLIPCLVSIYIGYTVYQEYYTPGYYQRMDPDIFFRSVFNSIYEYKPDKIRPQGNYIPRSHVSWWDLVRSLFLVGTACSLILFQRVLIPYPDLVAGSVRNSKRQSDVPLSGRTRRKLVWTERIHSLVYKNRLSVYLTYTLVRVIENIAIVVFFSRSESVCMATGHCKGARTFPELRHILYPAGISSAFRKDPMEPSDTGVSPIGFIPLVWLVCAVLVITCVIIFAQALVLNRSTASRYGTDVDEDSESSPSKKKRQKHQPQPSVPETATTTSRSWWSRRMQKLHSILSNEVGPPVSSQILHDMSRRMYEGALASLVVYVVHIVLGFSKGSNCFVLVSLAYMLAGHFVARAGILSQREIKALAMEMKL